MFRSIYPLLLRSILLAMLVFLLFSFFTRIAMLCQSAHTVNWDASLLGSFLVGMLSDLITSLFASLPWLLLILLTPARLWRGKSGPMIYSACLLLFTSILIFISTSEWFFWNEFGVRFNFIAVDYLVFTTEVVENIMQSYPMGLIFTGIALLSLGFVVLLHRFGIIRWVLQSDNRMLPKIATASIALVLMVLVSLGFSQSLLPNFANVYNGELAKNGCWAFFAAYQKMELDYDQWYLTLPLEEAKARVSQQVGTSNAAFTGKDASSLERSIVGNQPEHQWNVIVVCMESMSAEYMSYAGSSKQLTPRLDQLANDSLFFSNLRATGTRTVRGMEALTLSLPPTPGQAIFYRPDGINLKTSFVPFLDRGYDCAFLYGGHGQFDYMNRFFSTSGCRIVDLSEWEKSDVTMKTAWGACDEDLFHKAISEADQAFAAGKPFHYFCMTTSNHRPYDFPAGRIQKKSKSGRESAVQYADWAIGDLIDRSSSKPWFKDTLFVICADHCASSSGKVELDVTKYHIPAMIYNPQHIPAQNIDRLCSQIDVMPTVFSLLGWKYQTVGFGQNQLDTEVMKQPGRAFISNYQKIALLRENQLAILKPNREHSLYQCDLSKGHLTPMKDSIGDTLIEDTIAYYQTASWLFKNGKLKRDNNSEK